MRITVSTIIEAPLEEVWRDVADLSTHAEWMADAESIEFAGASTSGLGTVMVVPTRIGPLATEDWIIVTQWEDERAIGVVHVGIVTGVGVFRLEDEGGSTRFVWDEDLELPIAFGGRLGEVFARPVIAAIWRGNLRRLAERFR